MSISAKEFLKKQIVEECLERLRARLSVHYGNEVVVQALELKALESDLAKVALDALDGQRGAACKLGRLVIKALKDHALNPAEIEREVFERILE